VKLIIPQTGFSLKTESGRVIIEFNHLAKDDRALTREEVGQRLNRGLRMVDFYRRLPGEARLRSESIDGRVVIRESELNRWLKFIETERVIYNKNGYSGGLRPGKKRRGSVEGCGGERSSFTPAEDPTRTGRLNRQNQPG
jgi:hypothetical protein